MSQKRFLDTLKKKAEGFSADEIIEEYAVDDDGSLALVKRKITTKYYPPDTAAIKSVMDMDELSELSEEELEREKARLLAELFKTKKSEERNGNETE